MENPVSKRGQQTRERLRAAAHRLFLRQGYLATSVDAILAEAGIASKETLYRHYINKEALFADVLSALTLEQPGFSEKLLALPQPENLSMLRQALTRLSREILALIAQPGYLPLVRMVIAEAPRFPQLGTLFFSTVTRRGLNILIELLQTARDRQIIADLDFETVAHTWLGGLLAHAILGLLIENETSQPLEPARADEVVDIIMRALTP